MKSMRRALALSVLILLVLPLLAGCHGAKGTREFVMPEVFDETRSYEISFWAKNDTNKYQTQIYKDAIENFEALYPNITVNIRLYTDYNRIYNDVITNIATRTTPNVCITYPDHIATYLTGSGTVVPLDGLMTDAAYGLGGSAIRFEAPTAEQLVPAFWEECRFAGHTYALPFMRSSEVCYINRTYVEKLGYTLPDTLTWDFIWEVSEAAMAQNADGTYKVNGQKVLIPFIYKSTDNMMIQYVRQAGSGYSDEEGNIYLFNDTTKEFLKTIASHVETGAFSTFQISSYPGNFLNAGQCIFAIDSTAGATWMGSDAPNTDIAAEQIVRFETAVRPIPQLDPDKPQMISQGPSVCIFNKDDPGEVLASWLFMQYLLSNPVQIGYAETEGYVPVTLAAQQSEEYLDYLSRGGEDNTTHYAVKIEATKLLIAHIGDTFVTPVFNGSASLRNAAGQLIENVAKSVRRRQTVDEAYFDTLYKDISALYRLDQVSGVRSGNGTADLGPLPVPSVVFLVTLCMIWVLLIVWFVCGKWKILKKSRKNSNLT